MGIPTAILHPLRTRRRVEARRASRPLCRTTLNPVDGQRGRARRSRALQFDPRSTKVLPFGGVSRAGAFPDTASPVMRVWAPPDIGRGPVLSRDRARFRQAKPDPAEQAIGVTGCGAPNAGTRNLIWSLRERAALALWPGHRPCDHPAMRICSRFLPTGECREDAEDNQSHSAITTAGIDGQRTSDLLALSILRSAVY